MENTWNYLNQLERFLQLTASKKIILVAGSATNQVPKFRITNTKLYAFIVTWSTQQNIDFLKQIESGFKRTTNWNKYYSKKNQAQNRYLNILIDLFVLSSEGGDGRESYKQNYLPTVEMNGYNVIINERNLFDQPIKWFKPYNNIRMILTGPGDDYTTGYLLDYPYFKSYYKIVATDLSKQ